MDERRGNLRLRERKLLDQMENTYAHTHIHTERERETERERKKETEGETEESYAGGACDVDKTGQHLWVTGSEADRR